jgi:hypothetical protein
MGVVINSIGTSSGSGRDYSTINSWISFVPANVVASGNSYIGQCYNDTEFALFGSGAIAAFSGHTTDASHTITLTTAPGQSFIDNVNALTNALDYNAANGVGVRLSSGTGLVFTVTDTYVTLSKLQIYKNSSSNNNTINASSGNNLTIDRCIIKTDDAFARQMVITGTNALVTNSLFIGTNDGEALLEVQGTNSHVSCCTFIIPHNATGTGPAIGIIWFNPTATGSTATDCAFFSPGAGPTVMKPATNSGGTLANVVYTNCATDNSSMNGVTEVNSQTGVVFNTAFVQFDISLGLDCRVADTSGLINVGITDNLYVPLAIDIVGTSRPQLLQWTIGCWEFTPDPVTFDAKSTAITDSGAGVTTFTQANLTITAAANALVYQAIFGANVTAVTAHWDSTGTNQLMTLLGSNYDATSATAHFIFGLLNPTTGAKTFSISWTTAAQVSLCGSSWRGASSFGSFNSNKGTSAGPNSLQITCTGNDFAVAQHANDAVSYTTANGTEMWTPDDTPSAWTSVGNYNPGPSPTLTGTFGTSADWHSSGVAIMAASTVLQGMASKVWK